MSTVQQAHRTVPAFPDIADPLTFVDHWLFWGISAALVTVICLWVGRRIIARRRAGDVPAGPLSHWTRWPRRLGWTTIILFFGGFGVWASVAPLTSAAMAPGVVSPDGSRKTVQHLEGGIIRAIHVREGDVVEAGQPLITLEDVHAQASLSEVRERYLHLLAEETRLVAEQSASEAVSLPPALEPFGHAGAEAMAAQIALFQSRRETREGQHRILDQRIAQLEEQIVGLERVIVAQERQLDLIGEEVETVQTLVAQGLERTPRLLALQRAEAEIEAELAANHATIAGNRQQIGEAEYEWLTLQARYRETATAELAEVRANLATVRSQLPSREDTLTRTVVAAPISGTVLDLRVTTETGVLRPGEAILDIVPQDAVLIIDARLTVSDIVHVRAGQQARVLLTAYGQRTLPQIFGTLRSVSSDSLEDERDGQHYFLAKVVIDPDELAQLDEGLELSPGMPASVMIVTGERTVLDYLLRPFVESLTKTFREA